MDCRTLRVLALGLIAIAGCTAPFAGVQPDSGTVVQKPNEEATHKASTYVAFGDFRASAGFAPEHTPAQQKQYREEAKMSYLKAIEVEPKSIPAYLALGRLQQLCEDHAGAQSVYEHALKINPNDARLWFELGMCQCRTKNWNTAVEGLSKAAQLDPGNRQYSTTLGFAFARAGRYEDSFLALARHNGEAKAHYDLARMLRHLDQPELARQHAARAVQLEPSMAPARALAAEVDSKVPPQKDEIQTVTYNDPIIQTPQIYGTPIPSNRTVGRPIPMPPLPVVSRLAQDE